MVSVANIKREATSSSLADDGQLPDGELSNKLLEKRKRPIAPTDAVPSKKPREANWVDSSMPPPASASRSLKRSRESSPAPSYQHVSGASSEAGSPSKKLRVEVEGLFPVPLSSSPGQLKATTCKCSNYMPRVGDSDVPSIALQSLSASSTIVDSISPPQPFSMQPVAVDPPTDDLDWPMGRSSVNIIVPSPDLVTDLSGLTSNPSPFQSLKRNHPECSGQCRSLRGIDQIVTQRCSSRLGILPNRSFLRSTPVDPVPTIVPYGSHRGLLVLDGPAGGTFN